MCEFVIYYNIVSLPATQIVTLNPPLPYVQTHFSNQTLPKNKVVFMNISQISESYEETQIYKYSEHIMNHFVTPYLSRVMMGN